MNGRRARAAGGARSRPRGRTYPVPPLSIYLTQTSALSHADVRRDEGIGKQAMACFVSGEIRSCDRVTVWCRAGTALSASVDCLRR